MRKIFFDPCIKQIWFIFKHFQVGFFSYKFKNISRIYFCAWGKTHFRRNKLVFCCKRDLRIFWSITFSGYVFPSGGTFIFATMFSSAVWEKDSFCPLNISEFIVFIVCQKISGEQFIFGINTFRKLVKPC